ncbi:MAG TPA: recombinase family protein [Lachnospiraceae bacterium]|nr:recombinase family protein [Lachnospiraceae bacterium]
MENQKAILLQYAKDHRFPKPTFFVDDGVSGVTFDRPGFQAML